MTTLQEELSASEITAAHSYLEKTRAGVFAATEGLSEEQWNYRPASGGWSIAQIVEHMVIVQDFVLGPFAKMLAESPELLSSDSELIDGIIKTKIADRSRRFNAPESVQPKGQWTPAESLERLSANTARLIERLESEPGLRRHHVLSPPLNAITEGQYKLMDGYQWILASAGHNERHVKQILEVKAEPGFPAN